VGDFDVIKAKVGVAEERADGDNRVVEFLFSLNGGVQRRIVLSIQEFNKIDHGVSDEETQKAQVDDYVKDSSTEHLGVLFVDRQQVLG